MFGMNLLLKQFKNKRVKYISSLLTDDGRSLRVLGKFYNNFKPNVLNHKRKHIVSLNLWDEVDTKNVEHFIS